MSKGKATEFSFLWDFNVSVDRTFPKFTFKRICRSVILMCLQAPPQPLHMMIEVDKSVVLLRVGPLQDVCMNLML